MTDTLQPSATGRPSRRPKARVFVKGLLTMAALGGLVAVYKMPAREQTVTVTEVPPVDVSVWRVEPLTRYADTLELPAVVEPNQIVTVSAEIAGRVVSIGPGEGSPVTQGTLLVQLNRDLLEPQIRVAEETLKRDRLEMERMTGLVQQRATAHQDLDNARTQLAISEANLAEVRARLERTSILAPATGTLNRVFVDRGEYVDLGNPVAEIVDVATVKVVVDVPEQDIAYFALGQMADILRATGQQAHSAPGTITFISALADAVTRSTRMEITVPNSKGRFRSGQIVRARLTRQVLENAIFVPLHAVVPMEDSRVVYLAEAGVAQRRTVRLGLIKDARVQIVSGLQGGEALIVAGHRFVGPGQPVRILSPDS